MEKKVVCLILLIYIALNMSCSSDTVFLDSNGAYLPVKVVGNSSSRTMIILLHGGPGSGAIMYYATDNNFSLLENQFRVAYFDQRFAGISQGNADRDQLTLAAYVEDLHKMVLLMRKLHKPEHIYIMGHSFGGMLGFAYLSSFAKKDSISGYIDMDGLHNTRLANSLSIAKIRMYAQNQIDSGGDSKFWTEAINFYKTIDTTRLLKSPKHYEYVIASNGVHYKKPIDYLSFSKLFFSEATGFENLLNSKISLQSIGDDITQADLSGILSQITIPFLVLWGRHDGVVPLAVGQEAFDKIGTADSLKQLAIFEESAHEPFIEQSEALCDTVIRFIEKNSK